MISFGQKHFPNAFHNTFVMSSEDLIGILNLVKHSPGKTTRLVLVSRETVERSSQLAHLLYKAALEQRVGFLEEDFSSEKTPQHSKKEETHKKESTYKTDLDQKIDVLDEDFSKKESKEAKIKPKEVKKEPKEAKVESPRIILPKKFSEQIKLAPKLELVSENNPTEHTIISNQNLQIADDQAFEDLASEIHDLFESTIEIERARKEKKEEKYEEEKIYREPAPGAPPQRPKNQLGYRQRDAEAMYLERQSDIESSLRKSAAKHRKEEKERKKDAIERDELKRDVLKHEIRSEEITKSEIKNTDKRIKRK